MQIDLITKPNEWETILKHFDYDIYDLYAYVELCARQENGQAVLFVAREAGNIFCLPLIIRPLKMGFSQKYYDATSPYGYSGPHILTQAGQDSNIFVAQSLDALHKSCKKNGIISVFVRFHPLISTLLDAYNEYGRLVEHGETVSIDLRLSEQEMWHQMRPNHIDGIRKLRSGGSSVGIDSEFASYEEFCQIYWENMERKQADAYYFFSPEYFAQLREAWGEHLHLCTVKTDERLSCAGLFTEINGIVQCHLAGTRNGYVKSNPTKLMFDYMRIWAKARGNSTFHLGGGVGGQADSLFHFKAGFSKIRHSYYTWRSITDKEAYAEVARQLDAQQGLNAEETEGYFPFYRKN